MRKYLTGIGPFFSLRLSADYYLVASRSTFLVHRQSSVYWWKTRGRKVRKVWRPSLWTIRRTYFPIRLRGRVVFVFFSTSRKLTTMSYVEVIIYSIIIIKTKSNRRKNVFPTTSSHRFSPILIGYSFDSSDWNERYFLSVVRKASHFEIIEIPWRRVTSS